MNIYLISTPVPDWIDGKSYDSWPGQVSSDRIPDEIHVVLSGVATGVITVQRGIRDGIGILGLQAFKATNLNKTYIIPQNVNEY